MPPITALLHTKNDALRLGRALETLLPCAEFLIVDHQSADATVRIARQYGARIVSAKNPDAVDYLGLARHDWIFCLSPGESITEGLQASLFEWAASPADSTADGISSQRSFSVSVREQIEAKWRDLPVSEPRLVPRTWTRWRGLLPASDPSAIPLEGELLRFALP